jgi:two-component system phosphate regulon response regulator PhoB
MPARLMIVEDDEPHVGLLRWNFEAAGYAVEAIMHGDEAETRLSETVPDLLILDWMLPGLSGIELCRRLRQKPATRGLPLIMLTARSEEADRVRGFETGADDYVVKPFSVSELLARVTRLLRRAEPHLLAEVISVGDIELDRSTMIVKRRGTVVHLGPTDYRLLEFLMRAPGRVFSREQLLNNVWGHDVYIDDRTVDVHIGRLRKALLRAWKTDPHRPRHRLQPRSRVLGAPDRAGVGLLRSGRRRRRGRPRRGRPAR